jgi:accessory gene regulator protein AgrB
MLDKLIHASAAYLEKKRVISGEEIEIYEYGFHALYSNCFIFVVIMITAYVIKQIPQTIFYHIAFLHLF